MRVCDYIVEYLYKIGIHTVFCIPGGGAAGLNDGLAKFDKIKTICLAAENACSIAAVGYSKVNNTLGVQFVTTACAGVLSAIGCLDAYQDSCPVLFISGNVNKDQTTRQYYKDYGMKLRKLGAQEADILEIIKPITKYSVFLDNPENIACELEKAINIAITGRMGPVWIDIPFDVQIAEINPNELTHYDLPKIENNKYYDLLLKELKNKFLLAQRPIILAGNGIHLGHAKEQFVRCIEKYQIPFVTTFLGVDLLDSNHFLNIGTVGIKGSRCGNYAIRNADFILVLGSCLNIPITGYNPKFFSENAYVVVVDIDVNEHFKPSPQVSFYLDCDIKTFLENF